MADLTGAAPLLDVRNVAKRYAGGRGQSLLALDDISLRVFPGEFVALAGGSPARREAAERLAISALLSSVIRAFRMIERQRPVLLCGGAKKKRRWL